MKKLLILSIILFSLSLNAGEILLVDNNYIQSYKGQTGRWENISSSAVLNRIVERYGSSVDLVREINGRINYNTYLFIPYSDDYLVELTGSGRVKSERILSENDFFIWPVNDLERISSAFGMRNGRLHCGIDLPAPRGTPVIAAKDGIVSYRGYSAGHGNSILLQHRDNFYTRYSHNSVILVRNGDYVKRGQVIALVGSTGNSTGNHLHFEIRYRDIPLDPLDFLPENETYSRAHLMRRP